MGDQRFHRPIIADIGIGGITAAIADWFQSGPKHEMGPAAKMGRFFLRLAENALRKHGAYGSLKSFELDEVLGCLSEFEPSKVYVVDRDQRVLDLVPRDGIAVPLLWDIESGPLEGKADVIICYNVIRTDAHPKRTIRHLAESLYPNGLLSVKVNGYDVSDLGSYGLERMGLHVHQKI
ncbi:MAG TPA: hypothetical protein VJB12_00355, partial [Candidatus Nanoarchaeia archaeon]|nr:hypothetical protein [Candidatus Nanoarchaeia archaeon]